MTAPGRWLALVALIPMLLLGCSKSDDPFADPVRFNAERYSGMLEYISVLRGQTGTIELTMNGEKYALLEYKGRIPIGGEGVLGHPDLFLRIRFLNEGDTWHDLQRVAIKYGRIFIETAPDGTPYTISQVIARFATGVIEPGIQIPPQ